MYARGLRTRNVVESIGTVQAANKIAGLMREGRIGTEEISLREVAESFLGEDFVQGLIPRGGRPRFVRENVGVDVSSFGHIVGQYLFTEVRKGWDQEVPGIEALFPTKPTVFDGERVPGIALPSSLGRTVHPGQPYPHAGVGEHWWQTPTAQKKGQIISVTKEAVFHDRTGDLLDSCRKIGKYLRLLKAMRCMACLAGVSITIEGETYNGNTYNMDGASYNTYTTTAYTAGGVTVMNPNSKGSLPFGDYTAVDDAELLFAEQIHPDNGLPITVQPNSLVVSSGRSNAAKRLKASTQVRTNFTPVSGSGGEAEVYSDAGLANYTIYSWPLLQKVITLSGISAAAAKDWWFLVDSTEAFEYREQWPLDTEDAPPGNIWDFERDLVFSTKAREKGTPHVRDPRYAAKLYNS